MQINVFGPGCVKCDEARKLVEKVVQENNIDATVEKVSDLQQMMQLGVLSTPAISVNGVVKCMGRVPMASELLEWLVNADAALAPAASASGGGCCGAKCVK